MVKEINKCPACGALRPALAAQCPECGYDFVNTNCKVINELNAKFEALQSTQFAGVGYASKQIEIIKAFAIPQIKEELLDLLIYIQPKALDKNSKVTQEWRLRQKEVIQRMKMAFANDRKVLATVAEYESELNKVEKQWLRQWWQKSSILTKIAVVVGVLFILLLLLPAKDVSPEAYALRFSEAVEAGKYDKALTYLEKQPEMGTMISDQYLNLIEALVGEGRMIEAENLYNNASHFVSSRNNATHLAATSLLFIQHYVDQQYYDMADKFVVDEAGAAIILKALIANGDSVVATRYFRKNQSKFLTYSATAKKRVLKVDDEVIANFASENNLI